VVLGAYIVSHFSVPLEGASRSMGTFTRKGWLVEVKVNSSHSFVCESMGLNQHVPSTRRSLTYFFSIAISRPNPPELGYWKGCL